MSLHPQPTATPRPARDRGMRSWSVTRVVLGSLAVGVASALALTLGVLPGAAEAVVTGSLLVGSGLGWATLALASARTPSPQGWARVPAIAMIASGAGLIVLSPGDGLLQALNWVWPPLMLTLVGWTYLQVRRNLPRRPQWLLVPVLAVLVAAAVGAGAQDVARLGFDQGHPSPGRTYSVGGHRLHLDCRGDGGPTVVLFSGLGELSASWARVTDRMSAGTRVCAYDRAGQGWSDDVDRPQDGVAAAADLHALLAAAGEHGPYVLAGHSIGGPYALTYAARYPQDVAGLVLLDSSSPRQFTEIPSYPLQYALMRRGLALLPTLARIGLGPVIASSSHLPGDDGRLVHDMNATVRAMRNGRDELSAIPRVFEQSQALTTLGSRPLVVLTASENLSTEGWAAAQARLADLSGDSVQLTVRSSHAGMVEDAGGSRASADAITAVVRAVVTGSPVALP